MADKPLDPKTSGMADPQKAREAWLQFARPAFDKGKEDTLRTIVAKTPRERDVARTQKHWVSKKSFGAFHENYDLIDWSK